MKPIYWIILAVVVLGFAGYVATDYIGQKRVGAEELASQALSASTKDERVEAMSRLLAITDRKAALPQLQRMARETEHPEVLAIAFHGLGRFVDLDSLPLFFNALANPDLKVRQAAHTNLLGLFGGALPGNVQYNPGASPDERTRAIAELREAYEKDQSAPQPPEGKARP